MSVRGSQIRLPREILVPNPSNGCAPLTVANISISSFVTCFWTAQSFWSRPSSDVALSRLLTKWSCERRVRVCRVPADLVTYPERSFRPFQGAYFAACEQRDCNCGTLGFVWSPKPDGPNKGYMTPTSDASQPHRTQSITTL
jgi:hypothetical protein